MWISATRSLKWAYVIVVLSMVVPIGAASSRWVALATGGGMTGIPVIGSVVLLCLGIYRVATVLRSPDALASYQLPGFAGLLRTLGVLALYFGAVVAVVNLAAVPLMMAFLKTHTESGAEYFVVGVFLSLLRGVGALGLVAFELSRMIGFERQGEVAWADTQT
jgi:hypothetical protein